MNFKVLWIAGLMLAATVGQVQAGFVVDKYQGNDVGYGGLTRADQAIAGSYFSPNNTFGTVFSTINFSDSGEYGDFPDPSNIWPDNTNNGDFVIHVTGLLSIATTGTYTFRTHNDDGLRLRVGGTDIITDDGYHSPAYGGEDSIVLAAGLHAIDLVFFEGGGQAALELQVLNASRQFVLLGDTANGGLTVYSSAAQAVPEPASLAMWSLGGLGMMIARRKRQKKNLTA